MRQRGHLCVSKGAVVYDFNYLIVQRASNLDLGGVCRSETEHLSRFSRAARSLRAPVNSANGSLNKAST